MTKVVLGMSVSLHGIAGPEAPDADGMAVFAAILGWQFPLRSWRAQQGQEGGEDSVDSKVWQENFDRFGPQVIGRRMFDFGYPNWGRTRRSTRPSSWSPTAARTGSLGRGA